MAENILGFKFPQNRQKWPSISTFERPRTNSNEWRHRRDDWRHRRLTSLACPVARSSSLAVGGAPYTIYSIMEMYRPGSGGRFFFILFIL